MLRINLLPAWIAEQRKTRGAIALMSVLFVAALLGMLGYHFGKLKPDIDQMTQKATEADDAAKNVENIQANAKKIADGVQPLKEKVDFVKNVQFYNGLRPSIFRQVARYTERDVEYNSMAVQGDSVSISAIVKGLDEVARYYITLQGNPDFRAVSWRGLWGWPNANNQPIDPNSGVAPDPNRGSFPISVTAQLIKPVTPPSPPGGGGGARTGGGGFGMMGPGGGMPGGMGGGGYGAMMGGGGPRAAAAAPAAGGAGSKGDDER